MRRHIPVLAEAFRFYGAFVWGITGLVAVLMATMGVAVGALEGFTAGLTLLIPAVFAVAMGGGMGAMYRKVGAGLHAHRPWARYAALVLSVLVLGDLPFGLPLGLLGLGVLLDGEASAAFDAPTATEVGSDTVDVGRRAARRARQLA